MSTNKQTTKGQPAADKPAQFPFETGRGIGARPITAEQAAALLTAAEIEAGEKRGESSTFGSWGQLRAYKALACSEDFNDKTPGGRPLKFYGPRVLSNLRESGYALEGRVSVGGSVYRGFTSSALLELPGGRLVNVAIIHVCGL